MSAARAISHPPQATGFTLIEIMISLLILALLMSVAIPSVTGVTHARLKSAAGQLAASMRAVSNLAAMKYETCEMQFDLDKRSYKTICYTEPPPPLDLEPEKSREGHRDVEAGAVVGPGGLPKTEEEIEKEATFGLSEEQREGWKLKHWQPKFQEETTRLVRPVELPTGVRFDGIWAARQESRYTSGQAAIRFYPEGYSEKAILHLSDGSGTFFSIEVLPLNAKIKATAGLLEIPER